MDPVADKILICSLLILLGLQGERAPAYLTVVLIARELIINGLRSIAAAKGGKLLLQAVEEKVKQ
ncbi:MAG: hypothetical protein CM1200mP30_32950 [Pseudomonadota bacterium]|nr:MAG: hypothetical protein CM1200mP30_32950 [Pseudomonadota bacterium]